MAHTIECTVENESGDVLQKPGIDFTRLQEIVGSGDNKSRYPFLSSIREQGDTTFNSMQQVFVVIELRNLINELNGRDVETATALVTTIEKAGMNEQVRFYGK